MMTQVDGACKALRCMFRKGLQRPSHFVPCRLAVFGAPARLVAGCGQLEHVPFRLGSRVMVQGLGFGVQGLGFRV